MLNEKFQFHKLLHKSYKMDIILGGMLHADSLLCIDV